MTKHADTEIPKDYRGARKAFIAACTRAHADSIARVHPAAAGPRGNPLFLDSVALGPRDASKALLVIAGSDGRDICLMSAVLTGLLDDKKALGAGKRLVLVHALNPYGAAWSRRENEDGADLDRPESESSWSFAMLRAVLTEDMSRVTKLRVLELAQSSRSHLADANGGVLAAILKASRPAADIRVGRLFLAPEDAVAAGRAVAARALAEL